MADPSHMVGRCVGCGVVRRVRLWASISDSCVTGLQAVWELQGLEVTRETMATVKPCRCREIAGAVTRLAPDVTPERLESLLATALAVEALVATGRRVELKNEPDELGDFYGVTIYADTSRGNFILGIGRTLARGVDNALEKLDAALKGLVRE